MSRMGDAMITLEDLFNKAETEYNFWTGQLEQHGYNPDDAVVAAQYFGMMNGIALVERELLGGQELTKRAGKIQENAKLFRSDYEKPSEQNQNGSS